MAKKEASFIDLHAEKLALGLCVLVLIGAAVFTFGGMRFAVDGKDVSQLLAEAENEAQSTARAIQGARPQQSDVEGVGDETIANLKHWFEDNSGLETVGGIDMSPARTQKFPPVRPEITGVSLEDRRELASLATPGIPVVTSGRATIDIREERPLNDYVVQGVGDRLKSVELSCVSIAAQIDLIEQDTNFKIEKYPPIESLLITNVQLQRKDLDEPWLGWQPVDTFLPFEPPDRPQFVGANGRYIPKGLEALQEYQSLLKNPVTQQVVARTQLPGRGVEEPPVPYVDTSPDKREPKAMAKKWLDLCRDAMSGRKPFSERDLDAAFILARAAAASGADEKTVSQARQLLTEITAKLPRNRRDMVSSLPLRSPDRLMPIMAHDITAVPGHRYQYRIRYEALNIYAGNPGELKNPADAEVLTLVSDWSPPSRPVRVEHDTYFFLTKADPAKEEVTVRVFKQTRAGWRNEDFRVRVGERIGEKMRRGPNKGLDFDAGALCIDIDFDRMDPAPDGKKTVNLVYADTASGTLREKYLSRDRKDPLIQELSRSQTAQR